MADKHFEGNPIPGSAQDQTEGPTPIETTPAPPPSAAAPEANDDEWADKIKAEKAAKKKSTGTRNKKPAEESAEEPDDQPEEESPKQQPGTDQVASAAEEARKTVDPKRLRNNFAGVLRLLNGRDAEIEAAALAAEAEGDQLMIDNQFVPTSYQGQLMLALQYGIYTEMFDFNAHLMEGIADLKTLVQAKPGLTHGVKMPKGPDGQAPELRGAEARIAAISQLRGMKKVPLYNSGFYVVVRPMSLLELNEFVNGCDHSAKELGRAIGGNLYSVLDIFCRQTFMDLLPKIVVESNLINWRQGDTLKECVSIHDYEILVHAVCSLIYREGIEVDLICVNPKCRHVDHAQKIDLNALRQDNLVNISEEAMIQVRNGKPISKDQVEKYQRDLFKDISSVDSADIHVDFVVPTMARYLEIGNQIISKIFAVLHGGKNLDERRVQDAYSLSAIRMMAPWIGELAIKDEDGEINFRVKDPEAVMDILENLLDKATTLYEQIDKFVIKTRCSHIAYAGLECPVCHRKPSGTLQDFVPFDVQSLFFFLGFRELALSGRELSNTSESSPEPQNN